MKRRIRASTVCVAEGHLLLVRLRDPVTHVEALFPPGGRVEAKETPAETARRETLEETGLHVTVAPGSFAEDYPFTWAGVEYAITTHWFRATLLGSFTRSIAPVVDAPYNLGPTWLPVEGALRELSPHPAIARAVARLVRSES